MTAQLIKLDLTLHTPDLTPISVLTPAPLLGNQADQWEETTGGLRHTWGGYDRDQVCCGEGTVP